VARTETVGTACFPLVSVPYTSALHSYVVGIIYILWSLYAFTKALWLQFYLAIAARREVASALSSANSFMQQDTKDALMSMSQKFSLMVPTSPLMIPYIILFSSFVPFAVWPFLQRKLAYLFLTFCSYSAVVHCVLCYASAPSFKELSDSRSSDYKLKSNQSKSTAHVDTHSHTQSNTKVVPTATEADDELNSKPSVASVTATELSQDKDRDATLSTMSIIEEGKA